MNDKQSAFPLTLAKKGHILKLEILEGSEDQKSKLNSMGLTPSTLIQFLGQEGGKFVIFCGGKTLLLERKEAISLRVSDCEKNEAPQCQFCFHKGSCHGNSAH